MTRAHNRAETAEVAFDRIDDALFALDGEWRFTLLNDRAAALLDLDREAVRGERLWEVLEAAADTGFQRRCERAMETRESVSFEQRFPPLDSRAEIDIHPSESGLTVHLRNVSDPVTDEYERYEAIVEAARDGIYVVDGDGRFQMVNDAYSELTGYERETLLGSHVSMVVDEETIVRARALEEELLERERSSATLETTVQRADDRRIETETTFSLLPNGDRIGIVREADQRRERERDLELYQWIIEAVEDGVYAVDDDSRFLRVNDAFCEMTGYDRAELLGTPAAAIKGDQVSERARSLAESVANDQREKGVLEFDLRTKDGDSIPVEARVEPFPGDDGVSRCGIVRDVSERHERERKLRERVRQQAAVTELGRLAFDTRDLDELMAETASTVAEMLDADYCKVLELDESSDELLLRQGVGWDDGIVGSARVAAVEDDSQAAYTLESSEPVVVDDLSTEPRFSGPDLLTDHDVTSGISTIIGPTDDPWGVLGVHDRAPSRFSGHDVNFVQSVANLLGSAISRYQTQQRLRDEHRRLLALNDINALVHGLAASAFGLSERSEIEGLVCDRLASSSSYEFAWIGTVEDGEVTAVEECGVDGYLDDMTLSVGPPAEQQGPTALAHTTGEIQVVSDVTEDPRYEPWREYAEEYGFSASASIPIAADDTFYGTLNVYSSRSDAFRDEERDALERLGSIVAYAISSVQRGNELKRERNRVEFMNRLLRHNLLNSLNVVQSRLEMLDGRVDFEVADHLETATARTDEMVDFVETIRKVTAVIGRGGEQELEPIDIGEVVRTQVDRSRQSYPRGEFHLESAPDEPVVADELVGEVLDNVLANAIQHNPGEEPTVWIDSTVRAETVTVTVADDGPGIPDERKSEVFERDEMGFDEPGTGFGLYLVKEIVDSYGGDVTIEDNDPRGTRVCLTFQRPE